MLPIVLPISCHCFSPTAPSNPEYAAKDQEAYGSMYQTGERDRIRSGERIDIPHVECPTAEDIIKIRSQSGYTPVSLSLYWQVTRNYCIITSFQQVNRSYCKITSFDNINVDQLFQGVQLPTMEDLRRIRAPEQPVDAPYPAYPSHHVPRDFRGFQQHPGGEVSSLS